MAEAPKMKRIFLTAHAAALAFTFVAKVDGAQQPTRLRTKLKERVSGNFTFDEFETSAKAVAEVVVSEAKGRYVQLIALRSILGMQHLRISLWQGA